jgi:hypothetical protein
MFKPLGWVGFPFGDPWRFTEQRLLAILPILRDRAGKRDYITLEQAQKDGSIVMKDTNRRSTQPKIGPTPS